MSAFLKIIFSAFTFFTYKLARDYKGKACGQILQLHESELRIKLNSATGDTANSDESAK